MRALQVHLLFLRSARLLHWLLVLGLCEVLTLFSHQSFSITVSTLLSARSSLSAALLHHRAWHADRFWTGVWTGGTHGFPLSTDRGSLKSLKTGPSFFEGPHLRALRDLLSSIYFSHFTKKIKIEHNEVSGDKDDGDEFNVLYSTRTHIFGNK